jgi:hypothetical protein
MKLTISLFASFLILLSSITVSAQTNPQDTLPYKLYEVGLFGTGGVCVFNGTVPDGSKTDIRPAFTFGALGTYAANRDIGFALGLGYESRGMFFKAQNKTEPNETITLNYFSIQPSLRFKSFLIGVNIGLPISSSFDSTGNPFPSNSAYFATGNLNTVIDIRAEGLLPIIENDFGNLYFIIQASYPLTSATNLPYYTVAQTNYTLSEAVTKSPIPTVQIGLSYLFSPGAKTK